MDIYDINFGHKDKWKKMPLFSLKNGR